MSPDALRRLRVAHLDTGRSWRGGQAQVLLLMRGLARRGVWCALLAPPGPLVERVRREGLVVVPWRSSGDWDLFAIARAAHALGRLKPDLVHCHSARAHALGVPAARLARVRAVMVSRRVAVPLGGAVRGLKYRLPVDRYLCVSRSVMDAMRRGGVPEAKLALVPSGVAPESPGAVDLRAAIGAAADAPLVGTAAALTAEKRHQDLLEAAPRVLAAVPAAHFVWVGEGPRRAALERRRAELGLDARVRLLGFREDARALMAQCTVVALASELEGFATSLLDAQAAGVPVVATRVGGIPEVVRDGLTGRLVPPGRPEALAAALIEVLTRPELRQAMARAAPDAAREFHIDRTVERTLTEYRAVLGQDFEAA